MLKLNPFQKKKPTPPPRKDVLRALPLRHPEVTWGPDTQGDMVIHIPLERKAWGLKLARFIPAPTKRHIVLDEIGADVWEMCDGETNIETIRQRITAKYKLNHKEAEASLLEHLRQLARRRLIVTVAGPEEPPAIETAAKLPKQGNRRKKKK